MHPIVREDRMEDNADMLALIFNAGSFPRFGALSADPKRKGLAFGLGTTDVMAPFEDSDAHHKALLRRISEQDQKAMAEFYDQVAGVLYSVAVRIVGDADDAQEIVQEVFVQIWSKAGNFDPTRGTAIHWALGITRNRSIDRLRSRQRHSRLVEKITAETDISGVVSDGLGSHHLSGPELESVRGAVSSLPQEQCAAIEMAFFSGLSHVEISESLGEALGTVKARIRRGMMKLREQLKRYL